MRSMLATLLTMAVATPAFAQTDVSRAGAVELSGFKTYWVKKPDSCQPMISFKVKNTSSEDIGPVAFHMEVLDKDKSSVFANGVASIPRSDFPAGHTSEMTVGGDHDITARDCLGDMHEAPFASIHFAVRLTATVGQDNTGAKVVREEPMTQEKVPAQQ